jgi:hypothetical protein
MLKDREGVTPQTWNKINSDPFLKKQLLQSNVHGIKNEKILLDMYGITKIQVVCNLLTIKCLLLPYIREGEIFGVEEIISGGKDEKRKLYHS